MLEELLKKCFDEEKTADRSAENIKTAVLSRIEEEKPMKHFSIKPLLIAAAVTATSALSLATANAATDGAVIDGIARTFSVIINGNEVEGTVKEYDTDDGGKAAEIEFELPDDAAKGGMSIIVEGDDINGMRILDGDEISFGEDGENA